MPLDLSALTPKEAITAIYVGYYNRAPDAEGLEFWLGRHAEFLDGAADGDRGLSLGGIAQRFSAAIETRTEYSYFEAPNVANAKAFIGRVYENLFGRTGDQAGVDHWATKLVTGQIPVGEIIVRIIQGAQDTTLPAGTQMADGSVLAAPLVVQDLSTIQNKIEVGCDWVQSAADAGITTSSNPIAEQSGNTLTILDAEAYASARAVLLGVDGTQQSVDDAMALTDAFIAGYGNDAPVAAPYSETVAEDGVLDDFVEATDPDVGDTLTYSVKPGDRPDNGTLVMNADGTYTYTPDADFVGTDSFTYTVTDASGETDTATVTITVENTNDAPVAMGVVADTTEDTDVTITPNFTDLDLSQASDSHIISIGSNPANGTVTVNANGTITYSPNDDFFGTDSFQYIVTDAAGASSIATAQVVVAADNDAPVAAEGITASTVEDGVITGSVSATDVDNAQGDLTFSVTGQPSNGTINMNPNGTYTYTPNADYNGSDSFTYTVTDPSGDTDTATVNLTITAVDDAPVTPDVTGSVDEDSTISGTIAANDVDNDNANITYALNTAVAGFTLNADGSWTFNAGNAAYQGLAAGETQVVSTTYTATSNGLTDTGTITVTVTGTNDKPVASDVTVSSLEDEVVTGQLTATDVDGDDLTFAVAPGGDLKGGSLILNSDGSYEYTPQADFNGQVTFNYTVSDGTAGDEVTKTVTIDIAPVADTFTVGPDNLNGGDGDDTFLGNQDTLNAGDKAVGGLGDDTVIINVDTGNPGQNLFFAGFELDVETFRTTVDGEGSATFDMSSSEITGNTFHVFNSTADSTFNRVNMTPDGDGERGNGDDNNDGIGDDELNVYLDNVTENADVTFTTRPAQVTGGGDEVNIVAHNRDSNGFIGDVSFFGTPGDTEGASTNSGLEVVDITTVGSPLDVNIEDLNAPGAHTLEVHTDSTANAGDLIIGDNQAGAGITIATAPGSEGINGLDNALDNSITTITGTGGNTNGAGGVALETGNGGVTGSFGEGADTILGGASNDNLSGNGGNDVLDGAGGDDILNGGNGSDSLFGQAGDDTMDGGTGNDYMLGGEGSDSQTGGAGFDYIHTGTFGEGAGTEFVDAGADSDTVVTRGEFLVGRNTGEDLDPDDNPDDATDTDGVDQFDGGTGSGDSLFIQGSNSGARGTQGLNDVQNFQDIHLQSGNFNFTIDNDSVFEGDHDARVVAGGAEGETTINATNSSSAIIDASTLDEAIELIGGDGDDMLIGGRGNDTIEGDGDSGTNGGGNDALFGGEGDDIFRTGVHEMNGGDQIEGDSGNDTIEVKTDNSRSGVNAGAAGTALVLDAGIVGIETLKVIDNDDVNDEGDLVVTLSGFDNDDNTHTVHDGVNSGFDDPRIHIDGSDMDANESLIVNAGGNGFDEDIQVTGGAGADTFNMGGLLDSGDEIDGGAGFDTVTVSDSQTGDFANVSNIECIVVTGAANGDTIVFGADAEAAFAAGVTPRIKLQNGPNTDVTVDTTAFSGAVIIEDDANNNTFNTGGGNDTIIASTGTDTYNTGAGDDVIRVSGNDLDLTDDLNTGGGNDTVEMDNSGGAVTAVSNLDTNETVENYVLTDDGDRFAGTDSDDNSLTFHNGNVNTLTTINVDGTALTDTDDSFTVTLDASQQDADFAFNVEGSATGDTFVKRNDGVDNNIDFDGNDGDDNLILNGGDAGSTTEYSGGAGTDTLTISGGKITDDGFVMMDTIEVLEAETNPDGLFVSEIRPSSDTDTIPVTLVGGVTYTITASGAFGGGGSLADPNLTVLDASGNVVAFNEDIDFFGGNLDAQVSFTPASTGEFQLVVGSFAAASSGTYSVSVSPAVVIDAELCARLGIEADRAGIDTVIGKRGNDDVVSDSQFNNDLMVQTGSGNDNFDFGDSSGTVTFQATAGDIDGNDTLEGGTGAGDAIQLTADGNTADLSNTTQVETVTVVENGDANIGITITNNTFTDVADGEIDVDASDLDDVLGADPETGDNGPVVEGGLTLNAGGVTGGRVLDVVGGTGNDSITTGSGNDTVSAGAGNDTVNSGSGNDAVILGDGNDIANTGAGADNVTGDAGNDRIDAGDNNDTVDGGSGNDVITGGDHDTDLGEVLTGGEGDDQFNYVNIDDSRGLVRDLITDFDQNGDDCIAIETQLIFQSIVEIRTILPLIPMNDSLAVPFDPTAGINFAGVAANFSDAQGAISLNTADGKADYVLELNAGPNGEAKLWIDVNDDGVLNGRDIQIFLDGATAANFGNNEVKIIDTIAPTISDLSLTVTETDLTVDTVTGDFDGTSAGDETNTYAGDTTFEGTLDGIDTDGTAVTYTDINGNNPVAGFITVVGTYGTLTVNETTGDYTYEVGATLAQQQAIEALDDLDSPTDNFTVEVTDNAGNTATGEITVTVNGSDDHPVLVTGGSSVAFTEDAANPPLSGTLLATDVDTGTDAVTGDEIGDTVVYNPIAGGSTELPDGTFFNHVITGPDGNGDVTVEGAYGTLNLNVNTGVYTYNAGATAAQQTNQQQLAAAETHAEVFSIDMFDGDDAGAVTTDITATWTGVNDAPEITVTSVDNGDWTENQAGPALTFTANVVDTDHDDTVTVSVDSVALVSTGSGNAVAAAEAQFGGTAAANAAMVALLTGGAAGVAADPTAGDNLTFTFNPAAPTFDFLADGEVLELTYTVGVDDGTAQDTDTITIRVTGTNDTPNIDVVAPNDKNSVVITEAAGSANLTPAPVTDTLTVTDIDVNDELAITVAAPRADITDTGLQNGVTTTISAGLQADINAATLTVTPNPAVAGTITSEQVTWSFDANGGTFDELQAGDTLTLEYDVQVSDGNGGTDTETISIVINGTNDAVQITGATSANTVANAAAIVENGIAPASEDASAQAVAASGTLTVTDLDVGDLLVPTPNADATVTTDRAGGLAQAQADAAAGQVDVTGLDDASNVSFAPVNDVSNGGNVVFNWNYAETADLDWLRGGETLTITYDASVTDGLTTDTSGAGEQLTVQITGTNDSLTNFADTTTTLDHTETDSPENVSETTTLSVRDQDVGDNITFTVSTDAAVALNGNTLAVELGGLVAGLDTDDDVTASTLDDAANMAIAAATSNGTDVTTTATYTEANADLDWLRQGDTLTLTYDVEVNDNNGSTITEQVTMTFNGVNDDFVIDNVVNPADIAETDPQPQAVADQSGSFDVTDPDVGDTLSYTFGDAGVTWFDDTNADITGSANAAITAAFNTLAAQGNLDFGGTDITLGTLDAVNVDWDWSLGGATVDLDFLDDGERIEVDYVVTVSDGTATNNVTVNLTFTGTNDAPVIDTSTAGDSAAGAVTEGDFGAGDEAAGTLTVFDADLTDTVSFTSIAAAVDPSSTFLTNGGTTPAALTPAALAGLFAVTGLPANADTPTQINWAFNTTAADQFDFLAEGETFIVNYTVTVEDDNGVTDTQDVAITITGTNDAPALTVNTALVDEDSINLTATDVDLNDTLVLETAVGSDNTIDNDLADGTAGDTNEDFTVSPQGAPKVTNLIVEDDLGVQGDSGFTLIEGTVLGDTLAPVGNQGIYYGFAGADDITGGANADIIFGGADNDTIDGGAGDDLITGGAGSDEMTGGADADTFVIDGDIDPFGGGIASTDAANVITDFSGFAGDGDLIDFVTNGAAGGGVTAGNFASVGINGASATANSGFNFVFDANAGSTAASLSSADVATFLADVDSGTAGAQSFNFAGTGDAVYVAVTDGTDLGIFSMSDTGGGGGTPPTAGELEIIVTLQGVTSITAADLADFV